MNKIIAALVLSASLTSALAGCSSGTKNTAPTASTAPQPAGNGAAVSPAAPANNQAPNGNGAGDRPEGVPAGVGGGLGGGSIDTSGIKTKYEDITYGNLSSKEKLNIYLPNDGNGPFPVIVAVHGGAFMLGSRTAGDLADMLEGVKHGYAVVTVDYRLSGEATFPAAVNDVKAAIRYVRANAVNYNLNPDKIALWGDSAGANIASLAGTTGGTNDLYDTKLGNANVSDKVTAVVDWFGPINFLKADEQFAQKGVQGHTSAATSPESKYIGKALAEAPELVKQSNPETYITKDDPPFFIEHGTADTNVPTQQSIDFAASLESVIGKDKVQLKLIDGAVHGGPEFSTPANRELVFNFLDMYMKK